MASTSSNGAVDIHFSHNSVIDGSSLAIPPVADIVWFVHQSFSDTTAILVDPQHALWAHWMQLSPTPQQETAQRYLPIFFKTSWSTQLTSNLVFVIMTRGPLLSLPAFHALTLEINSPLGLYSLSGKTSYRKISWNLEAERLGAMIIAPLWHFTGILAALLPRGLSNIRAIGIV